MHYPHYSNTSDECEPHFGLSCSNPTFFLQWGRLLSHTGVKVSALLYSWNQRLLFGPPQDLQCIDLALLCHHLTDVLMLCARGRDRWAGGALISHSLILDFTHRSPQIYWPEYVTAFLEVMNPA